jgi:hypothetical protein
VMAVVRVMAVMGVVPRGGCGGVPTREGKQWCYGGRVRAPGDGRLSPTDAEAGIGDLCRGALGEHRREGDTEWDEKRLPLHDSGPYAYR